VGLSLASLETSRPDDCDVSARRWLESCCHSEDNVTRGIEYLVCARCRRPTNLLVKLRNDPQSCSHLLLASKVWLSSASFSVEPL